MSSFFQLSGITPYTPGEQPRDKAYVKLNTNESPFAPSPRVREALDADVLNRYPDPAAAALTQALAEHYSVSAENVFVGNGSDEVLAFAFYAYGKRGISAPDLSYGFYPVFADFFGLALKTIPLRADLSIDPQDYCKQSQTVVFANPNAPTGLYLQPCEIRKIAAANPKRVVIVDEAYIDFGGQSAAGLTKELGNLLVVGTFSKSRNLAGARVGFAIGDASLIADLNTLKFSFNPYNLSTLSIQAGVASLQDAAYFEACTKEIIENRAWSACELQRRGFTCTDSLANFLLAQSAKISGRELYLRLKEKGVLVRYLGNKRIENCVRITIGTREQMQTLFDKIDELCTEG
ncbi:MAG: histidinol-phosphate transaminase [Oscillospiraceae bacterium]|jgi:histidinol-phosphate aminotransferase|nr:histidinol-phosphate transaminase [Oscillospiraceae bacterium]